MTNRIDCQTAEARVEFVAAMRKEYPADPEIAELCRLLMRLSATHHRLQVAYCNRGATLARQQQEHRCERKIVELCSRFGCDGAPVPSYPMFIRNLRGATVKLVVPSGSTNDSAQIGIVVPAGRS
jgi:hypothetical protein